MMLEEQQNRTTSSDILVSLSCKHEALRGVNQCRSGDDEQGGDGREMEKDFGDVASSPVLGTLFEVNAGKLNYQ
eukprot:758270-Hanusia_phi.AAC.1